MKNYSVAEFRKNTRQILNEVEAGEHVTITRHTTVFRLEIWVQRHLTDEVSSNIRPDVYGSPESLRKKNEVYTEAGFVSKKDLENIKIGKEVKLESTPKGDKKISVGFAKTPEEVQEQLKRVQSTKKYDFCKHGNIKGLCKKGCK